MSLVDLLMMEIIRAAKSCKSRRQGEDRRWVGTGGARSASRKVQDKAAKAEQVANIKHPRLWRVRKCTVHDFNLK